MISKRARYALHGLAYIARCPNEVPVSFDKILAYLNAYSGTLSLSEGYIAKIFQDVARSGFTQAVSGPRGGYQLSRDAGRIRLIEIIEALDGPMLTGCCLMSVGGCSEDSRCGVRAVIREAESSLYEVFARETVGSMAAEMEFPDMEKIRDSRARAAQQRRAGRS